MRRVIALELVGLKKLDCDLYDEEGNVVYEKGTDFTTENLIMLAHTAVFKWDEEHIVEPQLKSINFLDDDKETKKKKIGRNFILPEPEPRIKEFKTNIEEVKQEKLTQGIKEILGGVMDSNPVKIQTCIDTTESILDIVHDKFEKVNNLGEMRVHDYYTLSHSINVAILSTIIGMELGYGESKLKDLTFSALLHDVGKMQLPKDILFKPGSLTKQEMQLVKKHSEYGFEYITQLLDLPEIIGNAALYHHERWEGQGYPYGIKGEEIPEFAQIVAIADVFDALISEKIYRGPVQAIDAMRILLTEENKSFNPKILNKFIYMAVIKSDSGCSIVA